MSEESNRYNIALPLDDLKNRDVLFKVSNPKKKEPGAKFISYRIHCDHRDQIQIDSNRLVHGSALIEILEAHGLSKTIPKTVKHNSKGEVELWKIDWEPHNYGGPKVFDFDWNGVPCSLTGHSSYYFIRVHDLTEGVGDSVIRELYTELESYYVPPVKPLGQLSVYTTRETMSGFGWYKLCDRKHRPLETIYIEPDMKEKLVNGLTKFYDSAALFDEYGVPWKRIHLFYGPPGSGKTSTVIALASHFNKNVVKLTVTARLNSEHVEQLFQSVPSNSFMILEDVDALFTMREGNGSLDFSTMLNCMDGVASQRGLVVFMTTNHLDRLDPAFTRSARVNCLLHFSLPGRPEQLEALKVLGSKYSHEHEEFLDRHGDGLSIADIQEHLFNCIFEERESILDYVSPLG